MKQHYILVAVFVSLLLLAGCNSCKHESTDSAGEIESTENIRIEDSLREVIYVLPSPNEILAEIFIEEVNINPLFVNPYTHARDYLDTRSQAVNLGVYIADFAYLSYSSETTTELEYLKVIKQLSEEVNIYGLMENKTMKRIQNNLTQKDTLNKISQELYYKISSNLENSNRENIFTLISTGAIVESLYLSVMIVDDFDDYREIIEKMYEQKFVFDNFYEYAQIYEDDPYVKMIIDQLEILKQTFDQLNETENQPEVVQQDDETLRFTGGSEFVVNHENFDRFKTNIISIRNEIVQVQ
ncbi:MAG: hypothetical protein V2I54_05380 [Bacteroidales bacterium]|jgi:hypothetical protein|nr:hypothetical protein [Bacteroidales bacterium]